MTKEYIVCLKRNVDYDQFWNEIENLSDSDGFVPSRRVDIVNNRDISLRQCHYALTDDEANLLKNDPRVYSVEEPTKFKPFTLGSYAGNFTKTTADSGDYINWGLKRCISETNNYGTGSTVSGDYTYALDGTNVDVVIQDSGIQADHPEFTDANDVSRVQQIDWFTASGVTGTMPANHYSDDHGHGTHVAGIAAGKTFGWAKNSRIYSVKVDGLSSTAGINPSNGDAFDVIIGWHNNKPVDPETGYKRPTIVNMSWGYGDYYANINGGVYRGTPWTGATRHTEYGMTGSYNFLAGYRHPARVSYIDVSIQEMIDAGIHVCIAAGNAYHKIDIPGGTDYNNYYVGGYFNGANPNYYHRGSSPYDDEAFIVGCIDSTVFDANTEQKAVFSECGPGVNIWAPGSDIMSSAATGASGIGTLSSYRGTAYYQANISGTSMASPQVCGIGALTLQMYPNMTPLELKTTLIGYSKTTIHDTGLDNDYTNDRSIMGSQKRVVYFPFSTVTPYRTTGSLVLKNLNLKKR